MCCKINSIIHVNMIRMSLNMHWFIHWETDVLSTTVTNCTDQDVDRVISLCFILFFFICTVSNFNIMKTLTPLMHAGLFWCFHNPPNSDRDYRIFNVSKCSFLHAYAHMGPWFIVKSKVKWTHKSSSFLHSAIQINIKIFKWMTIFKLEQLPTIK